MEVSRLENADPGRHQEVEAEEVSVDTTGVEGVEVGSCHREFDVFELFLESGNGTVEDQFGVFVGGKHVEGPQPARGSFQGDLIGQRRIVLVFQFPVFREQEMQTVFGVFCRHLFASNGGCRPGGQVRKTKSIPFCVATGLTDETNHPEIAENPIWQGVGTVCTVDGIRELLPLKTRSLVSVLILLNLTSDGLFRLFRLNRSWFCLLLAIGLASSVGCQGLGHVFGRGAEMKVGKARQATNGGLEALDHGNFDRAIAHFNQALEQTPTDRRIRSHLADTYRRQGNYDQAIGQMLRVVETSNDPGQNVVLGELYLASGQLLPAVRQAELALSRNRKLPEAWLLKGKLRAAKRDYRGALADYHRAMGLDPERLDVQLYVASAYRELGEPMRALATLEQLLAQYPVDQQPEAALVAKGEALLELEHTEEAIDFLARASRREHATAAPFVLLGKAQYQAGYVSEALTTINKATILFPNDDELVQLTHNLQASEQRVALNSQDASTPLTRK